MCATFGQSLAVTFLFLPNSLDSDKAESLVLAIRSDNVDVVLTPNLSTRNLLNPNLSESGSRPEIGFDSLICAEFAMTVLCVPHSARIWP